MVGGFFLEPLSLGGKELAGVVLQLFPGNPRVLTPYRGCYFNASCFLCPLLALCALTVCTHHILYCGVSPNALWLPRHIKSSVCYSSSCGLFHFFFSKCHPDCLLQNHLRSLFKSSSRFLIQATGSGSPEVVPRILHF